MIPPTLLTKRRKSTTLTTVERPGGPLVRFGEATDTHYGQVTNYGVIYPYDGLLKLQEAVTYWNTQDLDFVILNSDNWEPGWIPYTANEITKEQNLINIRAMKAVLDTLNCPWYTGFGNHEMYKVTKEEIISEMGMPGKYYYFDVNGIRFIMLDACYTADADGTDYTAPNNQVNLVEFIPPTERAWLANTLNNSPYPCIVFCHQLLSGLGAASTINVDNAHVIRAIMEKSGKVMAVFHGHEHADYKSIVNNIPYYVMQAQGRDAYPANAYAVVEVYEDKIKILGKGSQLSY